MTKSLVLLASSLALLSGCGLISSVAGVAPKVSAGSTNLPGSANNASSTASNTADSAGASSDATVASETAATEATLAKLIGADARYSAAAVQGAGSPICQADGNTALSIWNVDFKQTAARDGNLDCFVINDQKARSKPSTFHDFRDFQDHGMFSKPASVVVTKPGAVFANVQGGKFWAAEFSDTIRMLEAPSCQKAEGISSDFVIRHLDMYCDFSTVKFDVLTKDAASAKQVKLADEQKAFMAKALAAAKERGEAISKADAEALQKVTFPAAVGSDAAVVQAIKDHLASTKTGIEPGSVKKVQMTSEWSTTKSPLGLIMHRMAEVTVGFARTDVYAMDPNKKCAIATFDVKEEHDGAKFEKPIATGAATGWTNILCDRLK